MRNYRKKFIFFLLCFALILTMSACGTGNKTVPAEGSDAESQDISEAVSDAAERETADGSEITDNVSDEISGTDSAPGEADEQDGEEIILTDQAGYEVKLSAPAQRIVSCYYITTYACIALGLEDKLAGIESKADKRPIYGLAAPELLDLPDVGTLKEFNVEAAAAVEPDLVIMPKRLADSAEALKELGIPVLIVYPESQELLEEMITLIGRACGAEETADRLLKYYEQSDKELAGYAGEQTRTKVYMAGVSSYLKTAPSGMYQADMIQRAGGENAAGEMEGDSWVEVSYEDVLAMNPDVIIVPSSAEYGVEDIVNDTSLTGINAIENGAVYQMPRGFEEWDSPVPSGILGVRWLCSILHEETYSQEKLEEDVKEFYKSFYGFEPETIGQK